MPAIDLAALRTQIAQKDLRPIYLLVGEDTKLIGRLVDAIEAVIDPADRPFAFERIYAGDEGADPLAIASSARVFPMLGDRRIVVVLRAERLLKPKRASKAKDEEEDAAEGDDDQAPADTAALEDYFQSPSPTSTLVFVATEIDKARRLTKRLLEKAAVIEFDGLAGDAGGRGNPALEWLKGELTRAGRPMDGPAAQLLVSRCGGDITKLRGDVERLLLYTEGRTRISLEDVEEVVRDANSVEDDWAVVNALGEGDAARALVELGKRLDRGDSPHQLMGQLRWWVSSKLAQHDAARVKPALEALLRTDLALKSSGGDQRILVERLVVELTGRALPAQRAWGGRR